MPSFVVDSASNSDLNSPTSIERSEPLCEQLTQEVNSNNVDKEEPPQNKKGKAVITRTIGGSKEEEERRILCFYKRLANNFANVIKKI